MLVRKIEEVRMLNGSPNRIEWINVIFDNSDEDRERIQKELRLK